MSINENKLKQLSEICRICETHGAEFLQSVPVAPYTTFKTGGKCNIVKVNGTDVLRAVTAYCKSESVPFRVLGRGSNVLISDMGLDGVILLIDGDFSNIAIKENKIDCAAGAKLSAVCKAAAARSLTGIEFAYGIPGTVGGALYMNAGAYGGEMSDIVQSCEYLDVNGELKQMDVSGMELAYRDSVFRRNGGIITKVTVKLNHGEQSGIKAKMNEVYAARRDKQPLEFPSAGSTFKRPPGKFAAKLIEDCGLKGRTIGGAQVSNKHAGFIVNKGGASFKDIKSLIETVKDEVYRQTDVMLETEVLIWE